MKLELSKFQTEMVSDVVADHIEFLKDLSVSDKTADKSMIRFQITTLRKALAALQPTKPRK